MAAARSVAMTGGRGAYSYFNNSSLQREATEGARDLIWEGVLEKLDISQLPLHSAAKSFCIADFGCSTGPNTFLAIDIITKAVELKFQSQGLEVPEFQVFFNDTISNDFNTLFASLPPERRYFSSGVPGSFYGRLLPESSLHLIYSSCAIHWLSKIPEEVLDHTSPAWNGRNIFYMEEEAVRNAFAAQFRTDFGAFLKHRAEELIGGGLALLVITGLEDGNSLCKTRLGMQFQLLGSCLNDLADKGALSRNKVDSFKLPVYFPRSKDVQSVIEENGDFEVEKLERNASPDEGVVMTAGADASAKFLRSAVEGLLEDQFGSVVVDEIFEQYKLKFSEALDSLQLQVPDRFTMICALLRRKVIAN